MRNRGSWRFDVLCLSLLTGLGLLLGVYQVYRSTLINPDGVVYIGLAQRLPGDYAGVARRYPAGYPLILWAAHEAATLVAGPDSSMLWLYSAQGATVACRVLALIPLYFLGKLLVGARRSFWALLILIALPYPAQYGSDVLREWPYLLFLSLGFWLLYWGLRERHGWVLALVGLDAGLGYLIRPECAQLILFGLLGLGAVRLATAGKRDGPGDRRGQGEVAAVQGSMERATPGWLGAGCLLITGFLVPVVPYLYATGTTIVPHQLWPATGNEPPVISAIGTQAASDDPLPFAVAAGEWLETPVKAFDPQGDPLRFSLVRVPAGSRPVYEFRSPTTGDHFWTMAESEKDVLLSTYSRQVWDYVGIACYAYPQAEARAGLRAVHRFWSGTQQRHFYTTDERQKEAILRQPGQGWTYEEIAFYAFAEDNHPPDTAATRTGEDEDIGSAEARTVQASSSAVAWYAHRGAEPPAGATIEGGVFRWQPGIGQVGHYQVNIIVSDGDLESCQSVQIRVSGPGDQTTEDKQAGTQEEQRSRPALSASDLRTFSSSDVPALLPWSALRPPKPGSGPKDSGLRALPAAADDWFSGVAEDLMVFFLAPWVLGLYGRLRYWAEPLERVLVLSLMGVNAALVIARHLGFGAGDDRRYSLALVALTVFYIPVGLDILAWWIDLVHALWCPRRMIRILPHAFWFCLLVAGGLMICMPKLLMPMRGDKAGYRAAAAWLRQNTNAGDRIAVPDIRISFYAQRQGLFYVRYPNSRRADYIITMDDGTEGQVPGGWRREYSVMADRRTGKTLVIYRAARSSQ